MVSALMRTMRLLGWKCLAIGLSRVNKGHPQLVFSKIENL